MYPILFTFPEVIPLLGGKSIHLYGVMAALGFLMGLLYIRRESRRVGLPEQKIMDLFFYLLVAGIIGSRVLFVLYNWPQFRGDLLGIFRIWEGGLVFQGGVILAVAVAVFFARRENLSFLLIADTFSPALSLGHAFGRIGCFFAGCCFGKQCDREFPFAVMFPAHEHAIAPPGIPLYPVQIFESLGEFVIFFILLTYRRKKPFNGAVFLLYIILYAILRSTMEVLRGDTARGFIIEPYLSHGQFVSLLSVICAVFLWLYLKKRNSTHP